MLKPLILAAAVVAAAAPALWAQRQIADAAAPTGAAAAADANSSAPEGYLARGVAMYAGQDYAGALDQLGHYVRLTPGAVTEERATAQRLIGQALLHTGLPGQARLALKEWLTVYAYSPQLPLARLALADCSYTQGQWAQALAEYDAVGGPEALSGQARVDWQYRRAYCLMKLCDWQRADQAFGSVEPWAPEDVRSAALFYRAYIAFAQGQYDRAQEMLGRVDASRAPGDARDYYLAQIAMVRGQWDRALELARQASRRALPPELAADDQRIIGEALYNTGEPAEAIGPLERYARWCRDNGAEPRPSALYILGLSRYDAGQWEQAIEDLQPVAERASDAMAQSAYLYLGQAYLRLDQNPQAMMAFDKALSMDYDQDVRESAFYNYAVARTRGGSVPFGSAVTTFEDFLAAFPDSRYAPRVQEYVVTGYMTDQNYDKALESIERIPRPGPEILAHKQRVLYNLGARALATGDLDVAAGRLQQARGLSRYDADVAAETEFLTGETQYRRGRYADAADAYLAYLRQAPATAPNRALARYGLGYARLGQKRLEDAATDFRRVAADPQGLDVMLVADAYDRLGDALYYSSDFAGAAQAYDQAYQTHPSTGDYALYQRSAMDGFSRDYAGQLRGIDRLLKEFPSSPLVPAAMLDRAVALGQQGRDAEAIAAYRALVEAYPNTAKGRSGYLQMAMAMQNSGDRQGAVEAFREVVAKYPTSDEATLASLSLKRLYADTDQLTELAQFLASVPGAPRMDPDEARTLALDAAMEAWTERKDDAKLRTFVARHGASAQAAGPYAILAQEALDAGRPTEALEWANTLLERFPDNAAAETALAVRGTVEQQRGRGEVAVDAWEDLLERTSSPANATRARLALMRLALDQKDAVRALEHAEALLGSSSLSGDADRAEAQWARGSALAMQGRHAQAIDAWQKLAQDTSSPFGARAAVESAELMVADGNADGARRAMERFTASQTPHQYWLARGFIVLSDALRAQGKDFEANEYLRALRSNYPGTEADIHSAIDRRLSGVPSQGRNTQKSPKTKKTK